MAKVSIIVPVYNVERYLRECLDSIINQTLNNIEIICVNDGSTDHSLDILEDYKAQDNRICIINKTNSGYGHTMNCGLEMARGEYIGIVESDDFIAKEMFEKLYNMAIRHEADVVKSNYIAYKTSYEPYEERVEALWRCPYNRVINTDEVPEIFMVQPSIWSAIYRTDMIRNNKIRFNETPGASYQDTAFAFKVWTYAKRIFLTKEAFLFYRSDNINSSVQSSAKVYCICDEFKEMERHLNNLPGMKEKLFPLLQWLKLREYKWNYGRLNDQFKYEFLLQMRKEFQEARDCGYLDGIWLNESEKNEINSIIDNVEWYYNKSCV